MSGGVCKHGGDSFHIQIVQDIGNTLKFRAIKDIVQKEFSFQLHSSNGGRVFFSLAFYEVLRCLHQIVFTPELSTEPGQDGRLNVHVQAILYPIGDPRLREAVTNTADLQIRNNVRGMCP